MGRATRQGALNAALIPQMRAVRVSGSFSPIPRDGTKDDEVGQSLRLLLLDCGDGAERHVGRDNDEQSSEGEI